MPKNIVNAMPFLQKLFSFFSERKLQYDIISSFILLFLFENLVTLSFTYRSNNIVSLEFARRSMEQSSDSILTRTKRYLDDVQKVATLCHSLIDLKDTSCLTGKQIQGCLIESLRLYAHFDNIYIGLTNGNFLGVERRKASAKYVTQSDKALPSNIKFLVQNQDRSQAQGSEIYHYYNDDGMLAGEEKNEILNFDARTRPWFTLAEQKGGFVWTDIYPFTGTTSMGITAAIPVYINDESGIMKMAGVMGIDLLLDDLAQFMQNQKISDRGIAFIVSRSGQIVAYPSADNGSDRGNSYSPQRNLISVSEVADRQIQIAFQMFKDNPEVKDIQFRYGGETYLATFTPVSDGDSLDWTVGIVVPKADFAKNIEDMQKNEIFIILFVAIIATLVTFYLSKRISAPIIAIAQETQRLKEFYTTEPLEIQSNIAEIKMMIDAIAAMRSSLQSFGKFVPKVLIRRLMVKGTEVKLGGKMSEVTTFFSDIQGFTSISEKMSPDKLVLHLSDYFNELSNIIVETNGTIDKYIGDSIMAFWNAPTIDKNHGFNACHAALLCQKRLTELNRQWELEKKPTFITRIGLHTTEVIVGNIGSDEKINYTLMGDGVNLGSRLEGTNKVYKTKILVSESLHKLVSERFLFRPVDIVAVKGKEEGVKIYELVGQMSGDSRILPSKEEVDLCTRFAQGFKLYTEQRWGEALKLFEGLRNDYPQDYVVNMYIERCQAFKENPPKKNWDGIFVLTTK
ncbi:MAG: adenylate/guanylate cyclase domain-containing protein [Holosporales bacterium]|jgi:adenylate cyclase|nr:adenylate/guanylate cyclase domain-containing protein [Holosporales bacterium]